MVERKYLLSYAEKIAGPLLVIGLAALPHLSFLLPESISAKSSTLQTSISNSLGKDYLLNPPLPLTVSGNHKEERTELVLRGVAGYYSRKGCLGCSPNIIMSNGQPLKDEELTLAASAVIPLNSFVRVTNIKNGRWAIAQVTDRGGFRELGRVADLTPALKDAIGGDTDLMNVEIVVLQNIPSQ